MMQPSFCGTNPFLTGKRQKMKEDFTVILKRGLDSCNFRCSSFSSVKKPNKSLPCFILLKCYDSTLPGNCQVRS